ncbi:MAG: hypothetical protein IPK94_03675 [Saprospiraceae bacterium]|nr:hypothetical protein [Saprospiraceae bacterium]
MNRYLILILLLFNGSKNSIAQNIIVGGGPTISTYFGDLAPYNLKQSFSQLKPGIGLYFSKRVLDPVYVELDFEKAVCQPMTKTKLRKVERQGTYLLNPL